MIEQPPHFRIGHRYRVREDFVCGATFRAGEILTFVRNQGYSPHDESFFYEFRSAAGEEKIWAMDSYEPTSGWTRLFEPID